MGIIRWRMTHSNHSVTNYIIEENYYEYDI